MKINKSPIEQAKDTGLALILILLLFAYLWEKYILILPAIVILVLTMTWPSVFRPLAVVWFGLSHFLGNIISKILLTLIFAVVVIPVGLIRRISGADSMVLKNWKGKRGSMFLQRDHHFTMEDMEKPY